MTDLDDKAKKLKEIQDRLAEIQNKSNATKAPKNPAPKPVVESRPEPIKPILKEEKKEIEIAKPKAAIKVEEKKKDVRIESSTQSLTQEENNWRANKLKEDAPVSKEKPINKPVKANPNRNSNKLSRLYIVVSLIITLAAGSYIIYNTFFDNHEVDANMVVTELPENTNEALSPSAQPAKEKITPEEVEKNLNQAIEIANEVNDKPAKVNSKKVVPPKERQVTMPENNARTNLQSIEAKIPNGIIISFASNSTKELAIKNVNMLKGKGFSSFYYYMPDKDPKSPSLYKVYIGPYKDESAAMPDFKKIVAINDKAFISRMN